jgi:hypothetical protein
MNDGDLDVAVGGVGIDRPPEHRAGGEDDSASRAQSGGRIMGRQLNSCRSIRSEPACLIEMRPGKNSREITTQS